MGAQKLLCAEYWECKCAMNMMFDQQCASDYKTDFGFEFTSDTCDSELSCLRAAKRASVGHSRDNSEMQAITALEACLSHIHADCVLGEMPIVEDCGVNCSPMVQPTTTNAT